MTRFTRMATRLALAGCFALGAATAAQADDYPSRTIHWVVPFLPGTAPDTTVRIISEPMSRLLGQPVVVENRGGVAGNLGARAAARAAPDGYTWVYASSVMATNMRMYANPGFDVMKDFTHVGRVSQSDSVLVVRADSGIASLQDLVARLRARPGAMNYASGGVGTPSHMGTELFLSIIGAQALHVPYKGASESTTAVASQQVDFAVALVAPSLSAIQAGRLKPLAVLSPQRNPRLADVPTFAEAGVQGISLVSFGGLSMPAGTPAPVVEKVRAALAETLAMPDVRARIEATGASVVPSTPQEFVQALQGEIELTERLMKLADIAAQ